MDAVAERLNLLIDGVGEPADLAPLLAAEGIDEAERCVLSGDLKAIAAAVVRLEAWFRERTPQDVEAVQGYLYAVGQDTLEGVHDAHPDLRRMHDRGHLRVGSYLGTTALRERASAIT